MVELSSFSDSNPFLDLLFNRGLRIGKAAEGSVIAVEASSDGPGSIPVGTGEAGIDSDFSDFERESFPEQGVERIEPLISLHGCMQESPPSCGWSQGIGPFPISVGESDFAFRVRADYNTFSAVK